MAEGKKTDDYTIEMGKLEPGSKEFDAPPPQPRSTVPTSSVANNPIFPVLAYCGSSILMTVMNKYVLSGLDFNLNFFLLCVQVCLRCVPSTLGIHANLQPLLLAVHCLCRCDPDLQSVQSYQFQRF